MSKSIQKNSAVRKLLTVVCLGVSIYAVLIVSLRVGAQVQPFDPHSTGTDGALNITAPGITYLDPKAMHIDPKGDNIFNFTTITIAAGSILKLSEVKLHGPVYFLAQGDVAINGVIDLSGDDSPGPTATAAEQIPASAGSGGYSGGLGGVHGDSNHQALPGNGPGGGAAGDVNNPFAQGGTFTTDRFLVPLVGGSGGGGTNDNNQYGAQGGAGGGALLIASSTRIRLIGAGGDTTNNGQIWAFGGNGGPRGCGGSGGAVRLVANAISFESDSDGIWVTPKGGVACLDKNGPTNGLIRLETVTPITSIHAAIGGPLIESVPFALNLPSVPPPVITVASIDGMAINANPFSFPDRTINTGAPVPVVIQATNLPTNATVTIYLLSDTQANQAIPVTLQGTTASSSATVPVTFPQGGSRGFVKAKW